jgi:hypothetical protein
LLADAPGTVQTTVRSRLADWGQRFRLDLPADARTNLEAQVAKLVQECVNALQGAFDRVGRPGITRSLPGDGPRLSGAGAREAIQARHTAARAGEATSVAGDMLSAKSPPSGSIYRVNSCTRNPLCYGELLTFHTVLVTFHAHPSTPAGSPHRPILYW